MYEISEILISESGLIQILEKTFKYSIYGGKIEHIEKSYKGFTIYFEKEIDKKEVPDEIFDGPKKDKLGTRKNPAVVQVQTEERMDEVASMFEEHGPALFL